MLEALEALVLMLSPFTPHLCEELWEALAHTDGVVAAGWPTYDPEVARAEEVVVPVQVNGRVRARLTVAVETSEEALESLALGHSRIEAYTAGKQIAKVIVVPGKLVNIVIR